MPSGYEILFHHFPEALLLLNSDKRGHNSGYCASEELGPNLQFNVSSWPRGHTSSEFALLLDEIVNTCILGFVAMWSLCQLCAGECSELCCEGRGALTCVSGAPSIWDGIGIERKVRSQAWGPALPSILSSVQNSEDSMKSKFKPGPPGY